ncbi:MAG: hypothetical protein ACYDDQ_01755 [Vulcanimicrobiaceae bacterium]
MIFWALVFLIGYSPFIWIGVRRWGGARGAIYGLLIAQIPIAGPFYLIGWLIGSFFAPQPVAAPAVDEEL